jgi:iron complex outermembrane receptor protein
MEVEQVRRRLDSKLRPTVLAAILLAGAASSASAAGPDASTIADLSLEELANIRVTSVSKRAEALADAAASVFVITAEDIRRAGATSLPEALRLAPNLLVARAHATGYSISARGFNNSAGNKLLVLIDGRSVYTPLFSGVFWDAQHVMLEDVERIEVISGPGGTLWGTNAVNGVVNIITRSARDTQGTLVSAGAGDADVAAAVRYGGAAGADGDYRVYAQYLDRDHTELSDGSAVNDGGDIGQAGFRADWSRDGGDFTLQGDAYRGDEDQPAPGSITVGGISRLDPIAIAGVNLLARWHRALEGGSEVTLQGYYDRTERNVRGTFDDTLDVFDVQFLHALHPAGAHAITWGADYRLGRDHIVNDDFVAFLPAETDRAWASLFAEDAIELRDDLRVTVGARVEHNEYTGSEFLPSARAAWHASDDDLLWAAASRTVRAPSRFDREFFFPANGPPFLIQGGPRFRSETAEVYEVGYRAQPSARIAYSVTAFHTRYDHLRTLEIDPGGTFVTFENRMDGTTSGLEAWATAEMTENWRLGGGFTVLDKDLALKPGSDGLNGGVAAEGSDPDYTWRLQSTHNLPAHWELDAIVRGVAELPEPALPSYVSVDLRIGWKSDGGTELSLTCQDLFDREHVEFGDPAVRSEFGRTAFLKATFSL